jgi:hypothetical protein
LKSGQFDQPSPRTFGATDTLSVIALKKHANEVSQVGNLEPKVFFNKKKKHFWGHETLFYESWKHGSFEITYRTKHCSKQS